MENKEPISPFVSLLGLIFTPVLSIVILALNWVRLGYTSAVIVFNSLALLLTGTLLASIASFFGNTQIIVTEIIYSLVLTIYHFAINAKTDRKFGISSGMACIFGISAVLLVNLITNS